MLILLDIILTIAHLAIIVFNLSGWIWRKTRKVHLIVAGATAASWFLLGIWYGWGYCFLTDWHWDVKRALGETALPNSFIKYYADKVTGHDWNAALIDRITLFAFLAAIGATILVQFTQRKAKM